MNNDKVHPIFKPILDSFFNQNNNLKFREGDMVIANISATSDPFYINAKIISINEGRVKVIEYNKEEEYDLSASDIKKKTCPDCGSSNLLYNDFTLKNACKDCGKFW